jgi:hypothetical protein
VGLPDVLGRFLQGFQYRGNLKFEHWVIDAGILPDFCIPDLTDFRETLHHVAHRQISDIRRNNRTFQANRKITF